MKLVTLVIDSRILSLLLFAFKATRRLILPCTGSRRILLIFVQLESVYETRPILPGPTTIGSSETLAISYYSLDADIYWAITTQSLKCTAIRGLYFRLYYLSLLMNFKTSIHLVVHSRYERNISCTCCGRNGKRRRALNSPFTDR